MLCALLVFGLFPGSNEIVETVVHVIHDGHLPHSEAHDEVTASEDCDDSDEHGCTPLDHHCKCCASASAIPPRSAGLRLGTIARRTELRALSERGPPHDSVEPFLPPPIG